MGLASDAAGNVYVADAATERIRKVAPDGAITTLAGSGPMLDSQLQVAGGYRDGAAAQARFNDPLGIAVTPDGATVYVADALNHCIRVVHAGRVSTLSGRPDEIARKDGPVASAAFSYPRSLALGRDGTLYVSDLIDGVRSIANGTVTSLALPAHPGRRYAGIAVWDGPPKRTLFVGFVDSSQPSATPFVTATTATGGLLAVDPAGALIVDTTRDVMEADYNVGFPTELVATGPAAAVFTDVRNNTVRYSSYNFTTWIAARPFADTDMRGGGYRDGDGADAQFRAPVGITRLPSGAIVVADTGNRALRKLTGLDERRLIADASMLDGMSNAQHCTRVAIVGNSGVFYDSLWHDSMPGLLEARLNAQHASRGAKPVCVFALRLIGSTLESIDSFSREYLADGLADAVVVAINQPMITQETAPGQFYLPIEHGTAWYQKPVAALEDLKAQLAQNHVPLLVVSMPFGSEFSDGDGTWTRLVSLDNPVATVEPFASDEANFNAILKAAGVRYVDAFPPFLEAEREPHPPALFGTRDSHETTAGNALLARAIGDALEPLL